jgi:hypothetical protein
MNGGFHGGTWLGMKVADLGIAYMGLQARPFNVIGLSVTVSAWPKGAGVYRHPGGVSSAPAHRAKDADSLSTEAVDKSVDEAIPESEFSRSDCIFVTLIKKRPRHLYLFFQCVRDIMSSGLATLTCNWLILRWAIQGL